MLYRKFSMSVLALALSLGASTVGAKDAEKGTKSHDGKFVSASGDQFVMTHEKGKEHAHTLAADAKITCDGKVCEAADLKSDMRIRVTTKSVARKSVATVEAIEEQEKFAGLHEGTVVSFTGKTLTMRGKDGEEHAHTLIQDAAISHDSKACKADELEAGMKIRVTTKSGDESVATRVEALGKHKNFAAIHEGTLASVDEKKLLATSKDGKEHAHLLSADTVVTRDGKACKAEDLKPETKVRVTVLDRIDDVVIHVEALDKQDSFVLAN